MRFIVYSLLTLLLFSCGNGEPEADAYGNFTAREILISAETSGKILSKEVDEGQVVQPKHIAYVIDTVQNVLKKKELLARRRAASSKRAGVKARIAVLEEQDRALDTDLNRIEKMLSEGAASQKQLDDLKTQKTLIRKQIDEVRTNFTSIEAEVSAIDAGIRQVDDMLQRAVVTTPTSGTILQTYGEPGESVAPGKALFKMAHLDTLELKAYFSADQLASLQLGDRVHVMVDDGQGGLKTLQGEVSWISAQAEFTPKIIQTREERVNLVYAVKIRVPNDGSLRINMPGEVKMQGQP